MRVFMVSFDRALVGEGGTDARERHRRYAEQIEKLTIVVVTPPGTYQHLSLSDALEVYPTNARAIWGHARAIWGYFFSIRKHEGIDLLVAQDLAAPVVFILKIFTRLPLIASVHGVWWDAWFARKRWWHRVYLPILTWALRHVDAVRVVSEHLKDLLIQKGVSEKRIHVISTPVSLERFAQSDERVVQEIQQKYEYPIALSVGRLSKEKGYTTLLKVWQRVAATGFQARLLIAGEGDERASLEEMISRDFKDGSVTLLGRVAPEALPPYYQAARVFALVSESESFGKVLVEAGAAGLPCVAMHTTGAAEIIKDGVTGYLVPQSDIQVCAERIVELLKDSKKAKEMGAAAQKRCRSLYDGNTVTKRIIKLWRHVAKE